MNLKLYFAIFSISIFLLTIFNPVVSAEVIEEERSFFIECDDILNYTSKLNIINGTNSNYTNFDKLISPFMQQTEIYGGFSGSFLPPTQFVLDSPLPRSTENNNLILTSFVNFQKKNLLSGASVSWWRCPYFYNQSVPASKNWDLKLSIYHVDMPRNVNYSFENCIAGENYPDIVPEDYAHPSLIFQRSYTNCGNIQDDFQYAFDTSFIMPINDTLVNPDLPFNDTALPSEPEYNPRMYNTNMQYSHTWFNVTAPIYPNESYMVVWDIESPSVVGYNEAGSFWITATDIGNDGFGRTLVLWNNRTINELPIDLDSSVIFQIGMGAGITGTKLLYSDPQYRGLYTYFDNQDFEDATYSIRSTFEDTFFNEGWEQYAPVTGEAYTYRDPESESAKYYINLTNSLPTGIRRPFVLPSPEELSVDGETIKLDVNMYGVRYVYSGNYIESSSLSVQMTRGILEEHSNIIIHRRSLTDGADDGVTYDNFIEYTDSGGSSALFSITNSSTPMTENFFLTIENDVGVTIVSMYKKSDPREPFFIQAFATNIAPSNYYNIDISAYVSKQTNILTYSELGGATNQFCSPNTLAVEVYKLSAIDRMDNLGWDVTGGSAENGISKVDYYEGFESTSAQFNPVTSSKAMSFTATSWLSDTKEISQEQIVGTSTETVFFKGFYKLVQDNTLMNYWSSNAPYTDNSYIRLKLEGLTSLGGSVIASNTVYGQAWDSSWHEICASITGTFPVIKTTITFVFQGTGNIFNHNYRQGFFDNVGMEAIRIDSVNKHVFNQKVDTSNWNSTNYYSLMIPFKHLSQPDFAPICYLYFKNSVGTVLNTVMTMPTDFYQDFILKSFKTSTLSSNTEYVTIELLNFGTDSYLFLQDRNSDFFLNDKYDYKYNHFERYSNPTTFEDETFFSPHYSLSETDGEWSNADSVFTTTYFYFVIVHFVRFNDNDPEVISIKFDEVAVEDFEVYRFNLKSFGEVYTAEEWLGYLELKNRPTFQDKIVDALANLMIWMLENTIVGKILMAIGKFIYDAVVFLAPYIEALGNLILEAFVFIVSIAIYFIATWIMWNFTKFWILVGQDRVEEGIMELTRFTSRVTALGKKGVGVVGTVVTKGKV